MSVVPIHEARHDREIREYRNFARSVEDIARRALTGHGEKRTTALMDIQRMAASRLRENP